MRRPSPATVIACLALFTALAGTGVAQDAVSSAKRLIQGKQIARDAITAKHVKNGSLTTKDLAAGTVPDAYSRPESDARYEPAGDYLPAGAKAADADRLDGLDSTDLRPPRRHADVTMSENTEQVLFTVPGDVTVKGQCLPGDPPTARIRFDYATQWEYLLYDQTGSNPAFLRQFGDVVLNPANPSQFTGAAGQTHRVRAKLIRDDWARVLLIEAYGRALGMFQCDFVAYAQEATDG